MSENSWEFTLPDAPKTPELIEVTLDFCEESTATMVTMLEEGDMDSAYDVATGIVIAFLDILTDNDQPVVVNTKHMTSHLIMSFLRSQDIDLREILTQMEENLKDI